jgi:hypothetical protein
MCQNRQIVQMRGLWLLENLVCCLFSVAQATPNRPQKLEGNLLGINIKIQLL